MKKPNVVWFSFEDTSPRFGCYGDPVASTPAVDRLAASGRLYRRGFSTAPVSAPSRFAAITGVYAHAAGAHHMRTAHTNPAVPGLPTPYECVPPAHVRCVSEYLRAAGYYCTNNDKTDYQFAPGPTVWDDCSKAAHWRDRLDPRQPFFAVFNFFPTHESMMWADKGPPRTDPASVPVPPYLVDAPATRHAIARQYDHVADGDAALARLLDELRQDGLADDTLVFVWSDHGEGLPRRKRWPTDAGTHVPLIVHAGARVRPLLGDDFAPGEACDDLVSLIDLPKTTLAVAGIEPPAHLHGRVFLGPDRDPPRDHVFATRDRYDEAYDRVRSVRDRRFRYVRNYHPELPYLVWTSYAYRHPAMQDLWHGHLAGTLTDDQSLLFRSTRPVEELYDTDADPHELRNLADDPARAADLSRLRATLDAFLREHGDLGDEDEAQMAARMWPGRTQPTTEPVVFVPVTPSRPMIDAFDASTSHPQPLDGPARLHLHTSTQGAGIVYKTDGQWQLYTGPVDLPPGTTTLTARAHRYGYKPSDERTARFDVRRAGDQASWRTGPMSPLPASVRPAPLNKPRP